MDRVIQVSKNKTIIIEKSGVGRDGLSAYQIAISNGFIGTEQEWLDSLKGATGGNYIHNQMVPDSTWNVVHNLGYKPNIQVEDSAGSIVFGEITHVDENNATLTFSAGFSGKAYCS
jgi:hypothetical protein